jgi:protein-S-isoprenylcysteine O-methyltransferase Ste14
VNQRELQRKMYELRGPTLPQRITLAIIGGGWVLLAWWLLAGGGLSRLGEWLEQDWPPENAARRMCLAGGFTIYYLRILFTVFVFLKRGVGWSEVFTIAPWLLFIVLLIGIAGGTNAEPFGIASAIGCVLFVVGSWVNSYAEYSRHVWKGMPENMGRLYTEGLFRYSRHPNYLGDLLSFSGLCLITGAWVTAAVPALMLAGFVFVNIPVLDAHLRDHYGSAFDEYARRTRKLIPFVY